MMKQLGLVVKELSKLEQELLRMNREELLKRLKGFKPDAVLLDDADIVSFVLEYVSARENELLAELPFLVKIFAQWMGAVDKGKSLEKPLDVVELLAETQE